MAKKKEVAAKPAAPKKIEKPENWEALTETDRLNILKQAVPGVKEFLNG